MRRALLAALLLGGTALTAPFGASAQLIPFRGGAVATNSPDGTHLVGGGSGTIVTADGTWMFGSETDVGPPPEYAIDLNGVAQGGGVQATDLYVEHSGILYQYNGYNWYDWISGAWAATTDPITVVNGVCGTANGVAVSSIPTANLCAPGGSTPTTVAGTGPWTWGCHGLNGGTDDNSCSAPLASSGGVPAPAQAAGFTTLVIDDHFSDAKWANPATWLDCNDGSTPPASPMYYRAWDGYGMNISEPCSSIGQATDPLDGQLAMKLHYDDSHFVLSGVVNASIMQTTADNGTGRPTSPGFYIEIVARTDVHGGDPELAIWSYSAPSSSAYEIDGDEEKYDPGTTGNIHNTATGYNSCADPSDGCVGSSVDVTQYHKYAWRQTSDGSDIIFCDYVNPDPNGDITNANLFGCNSIHPDATELAGIPMVHQVGPELLRAADRLTGGAQKNMYVKSIIVRSCDTNPANLCHSTSANP